MQVKDPLNDIQVRGVRNASEVAFLWDMLYEAAAVDSTIRGMNQKEAVNVPSIRKYLAGWGREGDYALLAYDKVRKKFVGAIWFRLFSCNDAGYGFVADTIPELSMAVMPEYRGKGIGSLLLHAIIARAKEKGYKALSLSVDRRNRARKLYENIGFADAQVSQPTDTSIIMHIILPKHFTKN